MRHLLIKLTFAIPYLISKFSKIQPCEVIFFGLQENSPNLLEEVKSFFLNWATSKNGPLEWLNLIVHVRTCGIRLLSRGLLAFALQDCWDMGIPLFFPVWFNWKKKNFCAKRLGIIFHLSLDLLVGLTWNAKTLSLSPNLD